jgi:hypothetical protein
MLSDRFGALEALAYSSIKLARHMTEPELSMDLLVASAVLEFADDLRAAGEARGGVGRARASGLSMATRLLEMFSGPLRRVRGRRELQHQARARGAGGGVGTGSICC